MREWLWKALCEVVLHEQYSNLYLKDHLQELPEKDRALASRIFYGTLQNYEYCRQAWMRFAKRKVSCKVGVLLTFSVYQLLFLDRVPQYAVIDEAVRLASKISKPTASFVNAILRKVQKEGMNLPENEEEALALKTSLPLWLIRMWKAQYGWQKAVQFAEASLATHPVFASLNPLRITPEDMKTVENWQKDAESPLYIYPGTAVFQDPLYKEGKISILDPGSYACASYGEARPNETVMDLCAAPGGKTMIMAEQMESTGHVHAYELHEHRARLIENEAKRLHLDNISVETGDSTRPLDVEEADLVLCDVPCSGYGVLARKPDMKLTLKPEDMDTLIPLQYSLLCNGADSVRKGGRIVYSTCTLNKKENEKQVDRFLKEHPDFILDAMQTREPDEMHDGFFMARMKRKQDPEAGSGASQ